MTDAIVDLSKVTRSYSRGGESLVVLDELDLQLERGERIAIMGPSGSGKTTLLNLIGGLDRPDSGSVVVAGEELTRLAPPELAEWRAGAVGIVFQGFNLIPVLSAQENVELPLLLAPLSRSERKERARFALDLVGLGDRTGHRPGQLSGGQEQRVAIARAIVTDPDLILADEPTGDLDRGSADAVLKLLTRLNEELDKTVILVTHDPLAAESAKRTNHMDKGRWVEPGQPAAGGA